MSGVINNPYPPIGRPYAHTARHPVSPRFGGVSDGLANIFKPITEQFVYGFFAQDVIALWIPRIINSLRRGRTPYNPQEDPNIREKKPLQQWLHSIYMNTKGLNYPNAFEETMREIETGPGLLIVQSILLGAASAVMFGKLGLMMGQGDLRDYRNAFGQMLAHPNMGRFLQQHHGLDTWVLDNNLQRQFMREMLIKGHFKDHLSHSLPIAKVLASADVEKPVSRFQQFINRTFKLTPEYSADRTLARFLKSVKPHANEVSYQEALEAWIQRWSKLHPRNTSGISLGFNQQVEEMETILKRLVFWFNDTTLKNRNPAKMGILKLPGRWAFGHAETSVEHFLENTRKFRGFMTEAVEMSAKQAGNLHAEGWGNNLLGLLQNASEKVLRGTTLRKFALGALATGLAAATVIWVSAMAQRGKSYPANRNLQLHSPPGEHGQGASAKAARPHFAGTPAVHAAPQQISHYVSHQYRQPVPFPAAVPLFAAKPDAKPVVFPTSRSQGGPR